MMPFVLQVLYKEDFEKNKGKGFSVVTDTPELQRIKKTQEQISNVSVSNTVAKTTSPFTCLLISINHDTGALNVYLMFYICL